MNWDLKINGQSVLLPFKGLKFTHRISGFGMSEIAVGIFEFDIYDEFGQYGQSLLEHVPVQLFCKTDSRIKSRVYYIARRSISKNVCHFTAYDIDDLDAEFDSSNLWQAVTMDFIPYSEVLNAMKSQCGFTSITATDDGMAGIQFSREMLSGKSRRQVLEMISTAMCGIWCNDGFGGLELICLNKNKNAYYQSGICTEHTEIDYQGRQKITKLIAVNTDTGNTETHYTGEYGTVIKIESPFVACKDGTDGYVWQRIQGLVYQGWKCDKGLIDIPKSAVIFNRVSSFFTFGDTQLLANQIVFDVDASGIYFSGGADPQDDEQWNYDNYIQRQLNQKVEVNKIVGDMMITSTGRTVYRNENQGG